MLVARRENRLRGIAENSRRLGARHVMIMAADVVKEDDCRRFVNETISVYGRGMFHCFVLHFNGTKIFSHHLSFFILFIN